ncbi:MAG: PKD domain-containing protein [Flavobacteriales bacterium]|nr:PKD domain-containing protein [Flavobacteriales bacterium]MCW8912587.1 PKD domain-containing protein [Flavobacteriales bacterium]MCW8938192.1 PKD domain-containing protein [Flavobacteriales bacterium]MCW8941024.1 PKD domain-containing protein [Flavobacteriales bacterium]MCW8967016.1 PKD domain-containing protein [Flavobacteriales bacterium]
MKNLFSHFLAILFLLIGINSLGNNNAFRFKISGNNYTDETIVRMLSGASESFDGAYDAWKLFSPNTNVPSIYTQIAVEQELSINALPEYSFDKSITIYTNIPVSGNYTLTIEEIFPLNPNYKVSLTDISSNTHYTILGDTSIVFTLNQQQGAATFTFNISTALSVTSTDELCFNSGDGTISLIKHGNTNWDYEILDFYNTVLYSGSATTDSVHINNIPAQAYLVRSINKGIIDEMNITINTPAQIIADFILDNDTTYLSEGGIVNITNQSQNAATYSWDFGDGGNSTATHPNYMYTSVGDYTIVLNSSNNNCTEQSSKNIIVLASPVVTSVESIEKNQLTLQNFGNGNYQITSPNQILTTVAVYDITGKIVFNENNNDNSYFVSLENQPSGIYIVQALYEDRTVLIEKLWR